MPADSHQPRFAPFATMLVGVIVIYVLLSQFGRHALPTLEAAPAGAPATAAAKDAAQDALLAQRERALVTIGALPRPAAPATASRPTRQAQINAPAVASARRPAPATVKAVSAPATAAPVPVATAMAAPATIRTVPATAVAMVPARYYQVRNGDTLFSIARKTYGDGSHWKRIMQANQMTSPAALAVGQRLLIPPLAETHTAWNR